MAMMSNSSFHDQNGFSLEMVLIMIDIGENINLSVGVRSMIFVNKFGIQKISDDWDDLYEEIPEETIEIVDCREQI